MARGKSCLQILYSASLETWVRQEARPETSFLNVMVEDLLLSSALEIFLPRKIDQQRFEFVSVYDSSIK
jgi:hypothetical protein